jgi:uncharacterized phiE125 gp8 family phage protein
VLDLTVITPPTGDPVSRIEAKAHLRVDHTADDTLIDALISAATQSAENTTQRALLTQTLEMRLDAWPASRVWLPRPHAATIVSVKYTPYGGTEQTLASAAYALRTGTDPGQLIFDRLLLPGDALATLAAPIAIRYTAGYGLAAAVPAAIKQAMLLMIGHWYANREAVSIGNVTNEVPMAAQYLLQPYRVLWRGEWTE